MIKELVSDAILAAPRGSQTRLAEAAGVNVQTVNKWAHRQTAPEMHRWPAIEAFFGWDPGTMIDKSGIRIAHNLLHISDLHFEAPPDFVLEPGEHVTIVVVAQDDEIADLLEKAGGLTPRTGAPERRLRELIATGDVVRVRMKGSDAEVFALRNGPAKPELAAAAEKGKAPGARKAAQRKRKPKPRGEQ